MSEFRSFRDQSLHYFMRDHTEIPTGPIDSPAAWRGDEMRAHQDRLAQHPVARRTG